MAMQGAAKVTRGGFRPAGRFCGYRSDTGVLASTAQYTTVRPGVPKPQEAADGWTRPASTREVPTVAEWLTSWLRGRRSLSQGTVRSYRAHIKRYFIPFLGELRLDELSREDIADMFGELIDENQRVVAARAHPDPLVRRRVVGHGRCGGPLSATTLRRIHATLRAALYAAVPRYLMFNPAVRLELPTVKPSRARVWTDERVTQWQATGLVPSVVMVWTPPQLGRFLDHAVGDPWYALYHLYAYTGLRRGECCGLHWTELALDDSVLTVLWQISQYGWHTELTTPKTDASSDIVHLDAVTVKVLRAHRQAQDRTRATAGRAWAGTGLVFTMDDGRLIHPARVTRRFHQLAAEAGLPPIRLHDLRHTHATIALAAGASLKDVQHRLRHSHYSLTADTYAHVLPDHAHRTAEDTAAYVPRQHNPYQHFRD